MVDILYANPEGRQALEVAGVIGVHLSYLATPKQKFDLSNVRKVIVENTDDTTMPPSVFRQFKSLQEESDRLAGDLLARFVRHRIVLQLTPQAYELAGEKIETYRGAYGGDRENLILFELSALIREYKEYEQAIEISLSTEGWWEVSAKRIFDQVASSPLTDLALGQAEIKAAMATRKDLAHGQAEIKATMATREDLNALPDRMIELLAQRFPGLDNGRRG